ncbi:MAG: hypothetical protein QGH44_07650 [Arenicellales bacterium]|nr:hypothetical protein [Arenicellales bacterium]
MDRNSDPLTVTVPAGHMRHGQARHLLMLGALLPGAWMIAGNHLEDGTWLGITDRSWFIAALSVPVIQQIAVALLWHAQLCYGLLTRLFEHWPCWDMCEGTRSQSPTPDNQLPPAVGLLFQEDG